MECGPIRRRSRLGHAFFPGRPRGRELVYYFEAGDTVLPLMAISFHTLRAVPVFIVPRYPPLVTSLLERVSSSFYSIPLLTNQFDIRSTKPSLPYHVLKNRWIRNLFHSYKNETNTSILINQSFSFTLNRQSVPNISERISSHQDSSG